MGKFIVKGIIALGKIFLASNPHAYRREVHSPNEL